MTESVNVLRMIKMFGWESKIQGRIDQKREEEIGLVLKRRVSPSRGHLHSLSGADPTRSTATRAFYSDHNASDIPRIYDSPLIRYLASPFLPSQ